MDERTPILEGRVDCVQPAEGYRFSVDSLLLPAFVLARRGKGAAGLNLLDLGGGCGVMSAVLLRAGLAGRSLSVELNPQLHAAALQTARVSHLEGQLECLEGDLRSLDLAALPFFPDLIISNPPFFPLSGGRVSPNAMAAGARHEVHCTLPQILEALRRLLQGRACAYLTYPAQRLGELLAALPAVKLRATALQLAHPRLSQGALRFLVELGHGDEPLEILPPLEIHAPDGGYAAWYENLVAAIPPRP
jgi:tRNA1Val (adenine37-N6)-methyltransferase